MEHTRSFKKSTANLPHYPIRDLKDLWHAQMKRSSAREQKRSLATFVLLKYHQPVRALLPNDIFIITSLPVNCRILLGNVTQYQIRKNDEFIGK